MFDEKQNQKDICRALAWQHGDKDAAEALLKQYQPLIRSIRQNFCQGLSYEDLEQELILHFLEQTACYDPKKNPSFAGYITPRLRWYRMNRIRKEMTREGHEELTLEDQAEGTSLDDYGEAKATLEEVARLAALGSPFQGKGLAWTLHPSYGRRCPEGAEVGWGKRYSRHKAFPAWGRWRAERAG